MVKLDTQARQALSAGNEDLARVALERKNVAQTELQSLDQQVAELEAQQEKLTDSEQKLRTKIESFRTKKEVIKAQYSAAEAQVRISEAATGVGEQMADVGLAMQRAADKTEQMRARADAVAELEAAGTFDDLTTLGTGRGRHRPPARAALELHAGRRRAGQDEGRARARLRRRRVQAARGRPGLVIVRISNEGQFRLDDGLHARLNELDDAAVRAVEAGDEDAFHAAFEELLQVVRTEGTGARGRGPRRLGRHPAASGPELRRGGRGVHGRRVDPRARLSASSNVGPATP